MLPFIKINHPDQSPTFLRRQHVFISQIFTETNDKERENLNWLFFTMKKRLRKRPFDSSLFIYFQCGKHIQLLFSNLGNINTTEYKDCCLYFKFYYDKQLDNSKSSIVQKENEHGMSTEHPTKGKSVFCNS